MNKLVNGTAADICGQGACKFLIWMFCEGTMHRRGSGWYTVTDHPDTHLAATVQTTLVPQGYDIMFFTGKWINEEIVLVNTEGLSEDRVQHAEQVLARLLTAHHHPVTVLTAIVADDLPAIQRLLARMRTDMEKCLMFCRSSIFKYGEPRSAGSALACLFEDQIMNDLPSAIKARNVNKISEILKNMLEQLECKGIAQAQVGLLMQSLAVLLKNAGLIAADDLGALASELQDMMDGCESFAEFHTALHAFISSLIPASENEQHQQISRNRSICDQVEQYILNNYAKPLSIREIASLNFIAGGYLSALYKKHKGISLIEFITSVRMAKAQEIMEKQPDILLKEVAQMVGYNDPLYFSRIFKKTIGQSPSRFLKEHSLFD